MSSRYEQQSTQQGNRHPVVASAGAFLFCIFLLYVLAIAPAMNVLKARKWVETPCLIRSSSVDGHSDGTYSIDIEYSYKFAGQGYDSDSYGLVGGSSAGYDGKEAIVEKYPEGSTQVCYVNPDDPSEAVLARDFPASMLYGLFPLIVMILIVSGFISSRHPAAEAGRRGRMTASGKRSGMVIFGIFLLGGLGMMYPLLILPVMQVVKAGGWVRTPCTIDSSEMGSYAGSHGATYGAAVSYTYEFGGKRYTSSRDRFMTGTSNIGWDVMGLVQSNQPGAERVCYVDPAHPASAVLYRGFGLQILIGLVPLICAVMGGAGFIASCKGGRWGSVTVS